MVYPIMEHFYTLQGEGNYTGHAAYFIRLGGCDVGCTWCDVKDSWDADKHTKYSLDQILEWVQKVNADRVVVTGGEPTLYNLEPLTSTLKQHQIATHIETSGTNELTGHWDWITYSPKRFKKPLEVYSKLANELKVVIAHRNDLRWALELGSHMHKDSLLYIQPEWDQRATLTNECIDFVKSNPKWILSLQSHKFIDIP
jgi:organic radical activating enzyme